MYMVSTLVDGLYEVSYQESIDGIDRDIITVLSEEEFSSLVKGYRRVCMRKYEGRFYNVYEEKA